MNDQMTRVISSPSSSTSGVLTSILAMRREPPLSVRPWAAEAPSSWRASSASGSAPTTRWFLILFLAIFFAREQFAELTTADGHARSTSPPSSRRSCSSARSSSTRWATRWPRAARASRSRGIDLFLFGGLMHMRSEPETPGAEFRVAAAGPARHAAGDRRRRPRPGVALGEPDEFARRRHARRRAATLAGRARLMVSSVALINVLVLVFNLIPAYPLDGGRIARAAVWKVTGDRHRATRAAAGVGRALRQAAGRSAACCCSSTAHAFNGIYLAVLGWLLGIAGARRRRCSPRSPSASRASPSPT